MFLVFLEPRRLAVLERWLPYTVLSTSPMGWCKIVVLHLRQDSPYACMYVCMLHKIISCIAVALSLIDHFSTHWAQHLPRTHADHR